ncbi:28S rRNA (cytosine-C(5))-methyltransferase-like [Littorina saxatilis]|uniref:SAM-dependent MTase RsmB/NOP-type domain-containing protein n=1 Tax=Littorina saxatilis TaxID=31220 RepID=A0AAN9AU05_9CAEN
MDLYTEAAAVLEKFENKQGSVKSLVFATNYRNVRQLYALVCESLKYQPVLLRIFKDSESLQKEETLKGQPHLATVLLYEHLMGKGLGRAGRIRSCIVKNKKEIQDLCSMLLEERGVASLNDLLSSQCQALNKLPIPRYVRVNKLKMTVEDVVAAFAADGWVWQGSLSLVDFQSAVESLGQERFGLDPLLPDVLVFPPGTDLHDHPLTTAGNIVLQDRASCLPAHVLNPPQGTTVLDCCAAPGNKTSHAASLMANSGKILAYERDAQRMSLLRQQLRKTGVSNTTMVHQDFLSVDPHDAEFADVEYILVDPSCSGSGMMSRMDHVHKDSNDDAASLRLLKLQRFQISILKHALRFPAAQRVVYSTCSIHEQENEQVVNEVAEQVKENFQVKKIFPELSHRGKGSDDISKCCLRMSPKKDLTNGFFVACFERVDGEVEGARDSDTSGELTSDIGAKEECLQKKKKSRKVTHSEDEDDLNHGKGNIAEEEHIAVQSDWQENTQGDLTDSKKKTKKKNRQLQGRQGDDTAEEEKVKSAQREGDTDQLQCQQVEMDDQDRSKKSRKKRKKASQVREEECDIGQANASAQAQNRDKPNHSQVDNSEDGSKKSKKKRKRKLSLTEGSQHEETASLAVQGFDKDQRQYQAHGDVTASKKRKKTKHRKKE